MNELNPNGGLSEPWRKRSSPIYGASGGFLCWRLRYTNAVIKWG